MLFKKRFDDILNNFKGHIFKPLISPLEMFYIFNFEMLFFVCLLPISTLSSSNY